MKRALPGGLATLALVPLVHVAPTQAPGQPFLTDARADAHAARRECGARRQNSLMVHRGREETGWAVGIADPGAIGALAEGPLR